MSYIKRNLENVVRQVTREYPVLLVTGPRQVGKTTMLQKLMEGTGFYRSEERRVGKECRSRWSPYH